jgi:hypothetical protein
VPPLGICFVFSTCIYNTCIAEITESLLKSELCVFPDQFSFYAVVLRGSEAKAIHPRTYFTKVALPKLSLLNVEITNGE